MSTQILVSPRRYIQGRGTLSQLGTHLSIFGKTNPLILASPSAMRVGRDIISKSLEEADISHKFLEFNQACTFEEIGRVKEACLAGNHDCIISCGGGKALDTGRAAAAGFVVNTATSPPQIINPFGAGVECVQVPTVAASDALTASLSVVYDNRGTQIGALIIRINPLMILVDTSIIASAPIRTLVAGMGDALATFFEADAAHRTNTPTITGGQALRTALMMTRLCLDTLLDFGEKAIREVEACEPGPALEAVVEANILLSGLGYECGGLAAAHAIAGSLTLLHDRFDPEPYHGELVAFSTLTQLLMEKSDPETIARIHGFCKNVGLPTTFAGIGLEGVSDADLGVVAEDASKSGLMAAMPGANRPPDSEGTFFDPDEITRFLRETDE
ncbi:MAG: glycerol dehydrogenase, partial [Deltaproteobacteria bacterium]|nr:glycerol dehydrogenase [Deltaproteobacteria bacterium]